MTIIKVSNIIVSGNVRRMSGKEDISAADIGVDDIPSFEYDAIKSLAESIKERGLLQPIVVKNIKDDKYRLVAGWRRLMAFKMLGKEQIQASVIKGKKEDEALLQLIENVQRENLNPMDIALALDRIKREKAITKQASLANLVNKSQSWVSNYMSLLKATPDLQKAVSDGHIAMAGARFIMPLSDAQQVEALKTASGDSESGEKISKKTAKRAARAEKKKEANIQIPIRPLQEREEEQKEEVLAAFERDEFKETFSSEQFEVASKLWDYLFEIGRLVIKA